MFSSLGTLQKLKIFTDTTRLRASLTKISSSVIYIKKLQIFTTELRGSHKNILVLTKIYVNYINLFEYPC